uniref:Si:dkey-31g6.6 n=1 Tax=Astatotilapia calliptera TaxID=8154 RepID=A0AAX7UL55_ASTCA
MHTIVPEDLHVIRMVYFCGNPQVDVHHANLIIKESVAKQLLRTKRQDRPKKAGYPDEPMREHLLHMQALDLRARETNLEHWLNPHCYPRCDRNYGHPV